MSFEGLTGATALDHGLETLDSLRTGVVVVDAAQRVRLLNAAAEQLLGVARRQVVGRALTALPPQARPLCVLVRRALDAGGGFTQRALALAPGDASDPALCDIEVTPLTLAGEACVLIELHDAEPRLRMGRDLMLNAELGASRALARQLAHEIRNPLGGLRGAAQLLGRHLGRPELQPYVDVILREADRLVALTDRMLGPAGQPGRGPLNIHEPLRHVERLIAAEHSDALTFEKDFDPSLPLVVADRDEVVQALFNLVRNAAQAVDGAGRIRLRTRAATQVVIAGEPVALAVRTDVEDDGPGVPEPIRHTLFYPLVSGRRDGTGLGLALAQDLARRQGGVIEYTSRPGCTIFSLLLPVERP
jgi:two-component system, NtrC family, nitrogen regulation sensor histidine kinase GlnL